MHLLKINQQRKMTEKVKWKVVMEDKGIKPGFIFQQCHLLLTEF